MMCITCDTQHSIYSKDESGLIVMLTDQNYIPIMRCGDSCVPVIRLEDASLDELAGLAHEIFEKQTMPAGTLFMCSSVSYLARVGTTIYASEWVKMCNKFQSRWVQCNVGPLTPLIRDDVAGTVGRQLIELAAWYSVVYVNSIAFPKRSWSKLVDSLGHNDEISQEHTSTILYTVALLRSIIDRTLVHFTFHYSSSHSITHGLDTEATRELLRALLETLKSDFGCSLDPEDLILGEPFVREGTEDKKCHNPTIIVIGASHCARICRELRMRGFDVIDLSVPGWTPTDGNIAKVIYEIGTLENKLDYVAVIDILSNVTYRYEQYDGTLALPCKADGVYHMYGKVQVCGRESVINTIIKAKGIFDALPCNKIVMSPIPRYMFKPCCDNIGHCTETGTDSQVHSLLEGTLGLRKHMQEGLLKAGITKCTVPDSIQRLAGEKSDFVKIAAELKKITSQDNVHLTGSGYCKLSDVIVNVINELHDTAQKNVPGPSTSHSHGYYWRGFKSPVGSERPKKPLAYKLARHGGGGHWKAHHPYRKGEQGRNSYGHGHRGGQW
jgi:hypothetical protein